MEMSAQQQRTDWDCAPVAFAAAGIATYEAAAEMLNTTADGTDTMTMATVLKGEGWRWHTMGDHIGGTVAALARSVPDAIIRTAGHCAAIVDGETVNVGRRCRVESYWTPA